MTDKMISHLVQYGIDQGLIPEEERVYTTNQILEVLQKDEFVQADLTGEEQPALVEILDNLLAYAWETGVLAKEGIVAADLFDTRLMNCLTPRPGEVLRRFRAGYAQSPRKATDDYYQFSVATNYIRKDRIARDQKWKTPSPYGDLDITINLSKPEKDPKAIAAARLCPQSSYPRCQLCMENEGYAGRINHPARQNHRVIPLRINQRNWGFQYSPYVYYNEHCIVFNGEHVPMQINRETFCKLFDFVRQFPHYFLGSNADLPIVGGSILSHDHFQGGRYAFAMEKAPLEKTFVVRGYEDIRAGIVHWPMSVIRLNGAEADEVIDLAEDILISWQSYTDEAACIYSRTEGEPHNTITPIARMRDGRYELDLVLRNNLTTTEHPFGLYHPHRELHHIKKENIGLIEVMGLAVLPARLQAEMELMAEYILSDRDLRQCEELKKHADWYDSFRERYVFTEENTAEILRQEIGQVFVRVLEDAGVYKCTPKGRADFDRFIQTLRRRDS